MLQAPDNRKFVLVGFFEATAQVISMICVSKLPGTYREAMSLCIISFFGRSPLQGTLFVQCRSCHSPLKPDHIALASDPGKQFHDKRAALYSALSSSERGFLFGAREFAISDL